MLTVSCKDQTDENEQVRLFRPVNITTGAVENTLSFTWSKIAEAVSYDVELYKKQSVKTDGTEYLNRELVASAEQIELNEWTIAGLEYETTYYFRVRANAADRTFNSRYTSFTEIKTKKELEVFTATVTDADNGTVLFAWNSGYDVTYIDLSGSNGTERYTVNDTDGSLTVTGLAAGKYSAQIGNATRTYNTVEILVPILKELAGIDNSFAGVTLRWVRTSGLARIEVVATADPTDLHSYDISSAVNTYITLTDLKAVTEYAATVYLTDNTAVNTIIFTTKDAAPAGMITVSTAAELTAALETATDGSVIALEMGTYEFRTADTGEIANIQFSKGVTLMSTTDAKPVMKMKGFQLTNKAVVDLIRLEGINLAMADAGEGGYLFDHTSGALTVNRIEVVNCTVTDLWNSVVRADRNNASTVLNVLIDNCLILNNNAKQCTISLGGSATTVAPESITVTNSTITNIGYNNTNTRLISVYGASEKLTVTLANNTITINSATSNFVHLRGQLSGASGWGTVEMRDNIFYNLNHDTAKYTKTIEVGSAKTVIENNCIWQPFVLSVDTATKSVTDDDWTVYVGTVMEDPQFTSIDEDNYTPLNEKIATQGDPRWR